MSLPTTPESTTTGDLLEKEKQIRTAKAEMHRRIKLVEEMLVDGYAYNQIVGYSRTTWDLKISAAKRLITLAYKHLAKQAEHDGLEQRELAHRRFTKIFNMAITPQKRKRTVIIKKRNEKGAIIEEVPTEVETYSEVDLVAATMAEEKRCKLLGINKEQSMSTTDPAVLAQTIAAQVREMNRPIGISAERDTLVEQKEQTIVSEVSE